MLNIWMKGLIKSPQQRVKNNPTKKKAHKAFFFILGHLLLLAGSWYSASAQCLNAYSDNRGIFYVVDGMKVFQQESNPVQSYDVGMQYIAYVSSTGDFKYYSNGYTTKLQNYAPQKYDATDDLLIYQNIGGFIEIIYNNKIYDLGQVQNYSYGDSVVTFTDVLGYDKVFYKGTITQLEGLAVQSKKAVANLVVYLDVDYQFKVWHQGETTVLEQGSAPVSYKLNQNMVAYIDYLGGFKVYNNGDVQQIENFAPNNYAVGRDFVAYISSDNTFKVYYNGETTDLSSIPPKSFKVSKDIMVFVDNNNYFNVFYKGKTQRLENFEPTSYQIENGIVVYPDLDNRIQGFIDGKAQTVTDEVVNFYELRNRSVKYYKVTSNIKFFCNGKTVTGL